MKRRGFLNFMGGAAVAGPAVAKEAVAKLPAGLGYAVDLAPIGSSAGIAPVSSSASGFVERADRIADLRRIISGDFNAEEREEQRRSLLYRKHQIANQEIASLRSVSGVRKIAMYQDRQGKIDAEISRSHSMTYLERLLSGKDQYY